MDKSNKTAFLAFLMISIINVSAGLDIPRPDKLLVNIMDGEVIVMWKDPVDLPSSHKYNVQMAKYTSKWFTVENCTGITRTYCDISSHIKDYSSAYKVRVQLVTGEDVSEWTVKFKFLPNQSEISPPSFTLMATSSTLKLHVHQKPILRQLFPYGVIYTIYLEETGEENKTATVYLQDNVETQERSTTFTSLQWGKVYCVSIKVEGSGALSTSPVSPKQCLQLPEQEYFIIAVSSLSILGGLAFVAIMAALLLCYMKRPEKTPAALKPPVSHWLPLSVGEGTMEVVTDKGWLLSSYKTEKKTCVKGPETHVNINEDNEEEERRTSMDSGVSIESNSANNSQGSPPLRQDDSGFGSLGGPESSTSSQKDYPLKEERTNKDDERNREDIWVRMGCQLDSSSLNLDNRDSGFPTEVVSGGDYQSQSPSSVQTQVRDDQKEFKQMLPDLDEVVTGYRGAPQTCICSGAGQCTWCHKQGHYGAEVIKQYRALCFENELLRSKSNFMDSYNRVDTFSNYPHNTKMDTIIIDDLESTFTQLKETFPLLTALTPLPLVEKGQDINMNNVSLSLCDVQLLTHTD